MVKHLLAGIKDRNIAQCIYVSSDAVYPLSADVVDEQTPPCPYDLYGQMHLTREQYFRAAITADKLAILRPCAIYGVGDTHNSYGINRFVRTSLAAGEITLFGGGEEYRDHVHVGDVARLVLAAHQQQFAGVLNIASGTSWRFGEIAACIKARAGREVNIILKPRAMAITHRHFNITKLLRQFPNQRPCSIDAGIEAFLKAPAVAA
jgi:UDP-glucose 4-epimerase